LDEDPFLKEVKVFVARARYEKFLLTSDVNGFRRAADELVERFAKELKRRYSETRDRQQAAQH